MTSVSKFDIPIMDIMSFAFATPVNNVLDENERRSNISSELNYYYATKIKTKEQRRKVYEEFLKFSEEKKIPVGHDYILSEEFYSKYSTKYLNKYKETKEEKYLFKHIAILTMIRMTQKFNHRFDIFNNFFSFIESIGIDKEQLYFTVHNGGHPVSDFIIPQDRLSKKILMNSFDIEKEKIFKISNEKTLEVYKDKHPQMGFKVQVFYKIPGKNNNWLDSEMIEFGNAIFTEFFIDDDNVIKYSENLVSRFSFHLQKLSIVVKSSLGEDIDVKNISLFSKVIDKVKDTIAEKRSYYSDKPFLVEKDSILKFSQYLITLVVLLIERVDIQKNKETKMYKVFLDIIKNVDNLFFELHLLEKENIFDFIYDVVDIVSEHYKKMYPGIYDISDAQKEKIVELITIKIIDSVEDKTFKYGSVIDSD